jgi:bacterioferritin-associated ferredoxin
MVNRCVCFNVTFKEILEQYKKEKSLLKVLKKTQVGEKCGMCLPYIEESIKTGKTEVEIKKSL